MIKSETRCKAAFFAAFVWMLCAPLSGTLEAQPRQTISGAGVYFFGPSLAEADSVPVSESEALNNFATYSNQVALFAKSNGLSYGYVSARKIEVRYGSMRVFTLSRDSIEFGTIFTDGKKMPLLVPYVALDVALEEKAKVYFGLK